MWLNNSRNFVGRVYPKGRVSATAAVWTMAIVLLGGILAPVAIAAAWDPQPSLPDPPHGPRVGDRFEYAEFTRSPQAPDWSFVRNRLGVITGVDTIWDLTRASRLTVAIQSLDAADVLL